MSGRRTDRRHSATGRIPHGLRERIITEQDGKCYVCGTGPVTLWIHHIIPWTRGGGIDRENLVALCHGCHSNIEHAGDDPDTLLKAMSICAARVLHRLPPPPLDDEDPDLLVHREAF
jgi:hypothetical protein